MNKQKFYVLNAEQKEFAHYLSTLPQVRRNQIIYLIKNENFRQAVYSEIEQNEMKRRNERARVGFDKAKAKYKDKYKAKYKDSPVERMIIFKSRVLGFTEFFSQMTADDFKALHLGEFYSPLRQEKNSKDSVVTLLEKRNLFCRRHGIQPNLGVVLFLREPKGDRAVNWVPALPKPEDYRPGIVAVTASGESYITLGGDIIEGAKEWRSLQATKPTKQSTN